MLKQKANIGELCNGSTTDSDSVCEGSNPSSAAKNKGHRRVSFVFAFYKKQDLNRAVLNERPGDVQIRADRSGLRPRRIQILLPQLTKAFSCGRRWQP